MDYHAWARAEMGRLVRGYAYLGEGGETLWNDGPATIEVALGLNFFDEASPEAEQPGNWNRTDLQYPNQECVMQMARQWCLAPVDLKSDDAPPALGISGLWSC